MPPRDQHERRRGDAEHDLRPRRSRLACCGPVPTHGRRCPQPGWPAGAAATAATGCTGAPSGANDGGAARTVRPAAPRTCRRARAGCRSARSPASVGDPAAAPRSHGAGPLGPHVPVPVALLLAMERISIPARCLAHACSSPSGRHIASVRPTHPLTSLRQMACADQAEFSDQERRRNTPLFTFSGSSVARASSSSGRASSSSSSPATPRRRAVLGSTLGAPSASRRRLLRHRIGECPCPRPPVRPARAVACLRACPPRSPTCSARSNSGPSRASTSSMSAVAAASARCSSPDVFGQVGQRARRGRRGGSRWSIRTRRSTAPGPRLRGRQTSRPEPSESQASESESESATSEAGPFGIRDVRASGRPGLRDVRAVDSSSITSSVASACPQEHLSRP